jgi:DNA-binding transcriptional LysR family regulator
MNVHPGTKVRTVECNQQFKSIEHRERRRSRVSLKQWAILHAVIDHGGFAHAAEHLHLSQSAISYTISQMQKQLGVPILRIEGRKAQVTPEGISVLKRSRVLVREAIELEEYAMRLQNGQDAEVRLAIDEYFPTPLVMHAIRTFSAQHKTVKVHLIETSMSEVETVLQERTVDIAINGQVPRGFVGDPILNIEYVPVAHPEHRLFRLERDLTTADLENEIEIVVGKPYGMEPAPKPAPFDYAGSRWEVSKFDTAVSALCECLGYGWLPKHRIQRSLDRGKLRMLPLQDCRSRNSSLFLIYARPAAMIAEAVQLADILRDVTSDGHSPMH